MADSRTIEEYKHDLDDFIIDHPGQITGYFSASGHMDQHIDRTDDQMYLRSAKEGRDVTQLLSYQPEDGEFENVNDLIESALLYRAPKIASWVISDKMDYDRKSALLQGKNDPYQYLEVDVPFNNVIGYGYQAKTHEKMDTPVLRLVLKRDESDQYFHFKIQTAYAVLETEKARYLRQFESSKAGIDLYRDGKITVPVEQFESCRNEIMTKKEAEAEIDKEQRESRQEAKRKAEAHTADMIKDFLGKNGIPAEEAEIRTGTNPRTGQRQKEIWVQGKPVGFVGKNHISEKYRNLDEVKAKLAKTGKKEEKADSRTQALTANYNGLFFDRNAVMNAAERYGQPLNKVIAAPHITLQYRPDKEQEALFHKLLGKKVRVEISEYANNGMNEGFLVSGIRTDDKDLQELIDKTPSGIPHITVSVNDRVGARPKDTCQLFDGTYDSSRVQTRKMELEATVGEYLIVKGKGAVVITDKDMLPEEIKENDIVSDTPKETNYQLSEASGDNPKAMTITPYNVKAAVENLLKKAENLKIFGEPDRNYIRRIEGIEEYMSICAKIKEMQNGIKSTRERIENAVRKAGNFIPDDLQKDILDTRQQIASWEDTVDRIRTAEIESIDKAVSGITSDDLKSFVRAVYREVYDPAVVTLKEQAGIKRAVVLKNLYDAVIQPDSIISDDALNKIRGFAEQKESLFDGDKNISDGYKKIESLIKKEIAEELDGRMAPVRAETIVIPAENREINGAVKLNDSIKKANIPDKKSGRKDDKHRKTNKNKDGFSI